MLRNLNRSSGGRRILGTPYVGLLAAQIAAETASGDNGPGILYAWSTEPANAGKRLRLRVSPWPSVGNLFVQENGAWSWADLPAGSHVANYAAYADNAYQGDSSFTVNVGVIDATAAGATLTGTATLTPGSAAGEVNATAPGADLTGTATLEPGAASGQQNATEPGADLTGTADLQPGTASGSEAGQAPGATLTGTASIEPGAASGQQNATAPGANLTGTAELIPGTAEGIDSSVAPGANLTGTASLEAGAATGQQNVTAPGATLTGTSSLTAGAAGAATLTINLLYIVRAQARRTRVVGGARNTTISRRPS